MNILQQTASGVFNGKINFNNPSIILPVEARISIIRIKSSLDSLKNTDYIFLNKKLSHHIFRGQFDESQVDIYFLDIMNHFKKNYEFKMENLKTGDDFYLTIFLSEIKLKTK